VVIIQTSSVLWADISFTHQVDLNKKAIETILSRSKDIINIQLPCSTYNLEAPQLDRALTLANFKKLDWLNLSEAPISTICFLYGAPYLRIIDVSGCTLLVDDDFVVLKDCHKLEQVYISFTNITQPTLKCVCDGKPLVVVDACDILLDIEHCRDILENSYGHIVYFHISLQDTVDENDFNETIVNCFVDTSIVIYKHE